ncbi:filamentous hemagglutinin family protein [Sphingobium sp. B11D3A]|nr:filamentous hemagglutinin family protein [Sphingobium sp. B11D3A]
MGGTVAIDNGSGATLNRVTGNSISSIDGLLQATGSAYLINRNGIVIGKEGRIDVGGRFVGSTQDMSNESFLAGGNLTLAGASEASIVNYGKIGSLGGDVVLVAAKVDNQGAIEAENGTVGLLAGYQVMLRDQADNQGKFSVVVGGAGTSVTNAGQLKAAEAELRAQHGNIYALAGTSGAIDARGVSAQGGRIFLTAGGSGEVTVDSTLTARKADGSGGTIEVTGNNILLDQGAKLDASGTRGGLVLVGGDWQGGQDASLRLAAHDLQRANAVVMAPNAVIDVSGSAGAGGKAVLWSDAYTNFLGTINASGATDGGRVETSSKENLQALGNVNAVGGAGKGGEWLLDPTDITITSGTSGGSYAGGTFTPSAGTATVSAASISSTLSSGSDVVISTASGFGGAGKITVSSAITKSGGSDATLTLRATTDILVGASISSTSGKLNLVLNSRQDSTADKDGFVGNVVINGAITTGGGNVTIGGGVGAAFSSVGYFASGITLNSAINAQGGDIVMRGFSYTNTSFNDHYGIRQASPLTTTGSGKISLTGHVSGVTSNWYSSGGILATALTTDSGDIMLNASGEGGGGGSNATLILSGTISSAGGNINLSGSGIESYNTGIYINGASIVSPNSVVMLDANMSPVTGLYSITNGSTAFVNFSSKKLIINGHTSPWVWNTVGASQNLSVGSGGVEVIGSGYLAIGSTNITTTGLFKAEMAGMTVSNLTAGGVQVNTLSLASANFDSIVSSSGIAVNAGGISVLSTGQVAAAGDILLNSTAAYSISTGSITQNASSGKISLTGLSVSTGAITQYGSSDILIDTKSTINLASITKMAAATGASKLDILAGGNINVASGAIAAQAGAGKFDVTLNARSAGGSGTVTVDKAITTQGGNLIIRGGSAALGSVLDPTLAYSAYVNELTATGAGVVLNSGAAINTGAGDIEIRALAQNSTNDGLSLVNGSLTTNQGNLRVYGLGGASSGYGLIVGSGRTLGATGSGAVTAYGAAQSSSTGGGVGMNGTISSNGGNVFIAGVAGSAGTSYGVSISGAGASTKVLSGAGSLTIRGAIAGNTGGNHGVWINNGTVVSTAGTGSITIVGTAGSAANTYGVSLASTGTAALVSASGGGNVTITGTGSSGSGTNYGVLLTSSSGSTNSVIDLVGGSLSITGTGGSGSGTANYGVYLNGTSSSTLAKLTSGSLSITGIGGPSATYGLYQGGSGAALLGGAAMSGDITLRGSKLFLNGAGGALLPQTTGRVTLAPLAGGSMIVNSDVLAAVIASNTMRYANYGAVQFGAADGGALSFAVPIGAETFNAPLAFGSSSAITLSSGTSSQPLTATKGLSFVGSATVTQTVDIVTNKVSGAAGNIILTRAGNSITSVGPMTVSGNLSLNTGGALSLNGPISAGTLAIRSEGDLTLSGGATVTTSGSDTVGALQLATGTKFINNAGASALNAAGDRWLVWSQSPSLDNTGGLTSNFLQYSAYYGTTKPLGTGNGLLYSFAPQLTISLTGSTSKIYDGTTVANLAQTNYIVTGLLNGDTATVYGVGNYNTKNIGTGKQVTVEDLATVVKNGATRVYGYSLSTATLSANMGAITARDLTASLTGEISKIYDGNTTAALGTNNFALANLAAGDNVQLLFPATGLYDNRNAGTGHKVTVTGLSLTGADAGNYTVNGTATANLGVILAKQLGATLVGSVTKAYDGNILTSGFSASNVNLTGVVSGDTVALGAGLLGIYADKNAGTGKNVTAYGLNLTGADAANYTIVSSATGAIGTIARKDLTATLISPVSKVYDGTTTATLLPANLAGIVAGDAVTISATAANYADVNAGTNKLVTVSGLSLSGGDASNYNLTSTSASGNVGTITARAVVIGITGKGAKVYDGTTSLTPAQYAGIGFTLASGNPATQTLLAADGIGLDTSAVTATLADRNAGTGKAMLVTGYVLTNNLLGNYVLASTTTNGLADVAKAALTLTAGSDSKIYDGTVLSTGVVSATGLVSGDTFTASQAFDSRNAGSRMLQVQNGYVINDGNSGGNYDVTRVNTAGTISKRTVSTVVHVDDKMYDGTTVATGTFDPLSNVIAGDAVAANATFAFADKNVGTNKTVTISSAGLTGADAGNYILDPLANSTATITKANLVLTAVSDTKTYDRTTTSAALVQGVGLATGDSFTATQAFDGYTAGAHNLQVENGWVVNDGNGGNNYNVSIGALAVGTIAKRVLTATATVANKTYDGTTIATGTLSSLGNLITGDMVSIDGSGGSLAFYDRNAGLNKTVVASGYLLTGADAANYTLDSIANSTATISRANLTLTAVSDTRQYDGTTLSTGAVQANGLVGGDGFTATQYFDGKNAGGHLIQVGAYTVFDGNGGNNYNVSYGAAASGAITKRILQASATINDKTYDGTASATGSFTGLINVIAGEDVTLDSNGATLAFYDRNAGVGKTVTVNGVNLGGADAANYALSDIANGTAAINKATLTLTAVSDSRTYDGTRGSNGAVLNSGLIAGDSITATQAFDTKNAGSRTLQVDGWTIEDGNGGGNYTVVLGNAATGSIAQKQLDGTLTGTVTKTYDRTTAATLLPVNIAGVVAGDDLVVTTSGANFDNVNVGTGKTVTVSGMQLTGVDAGNYVLNATSASADIGTITARELEITVTGRGAKTYDGTTLLTAAQFGDFVFTLANGDSVTQSMLAADSVSLGQTGLVGTLADRNAGDGKGVTLTGFALDNNGLGNYTLKSTSALALADVSRATLTLNAVADSKTYDGKVASTGVVTWSGLIANDSVTATQAFDSKNAGSRTISVDSWTIDDGNNGSNYTVVRNNAAGWIDKKAISATLTGTVTKQYDGTTTATLLPSNLVDIVAGDAVTVTATSANYADKNAGTGKLVTVSGIQLSGADAANYDLLDTNASAYVGTIEARRVVVSATGSGHKTYDGTTVLTSGQLGTLGLLIVDNDTRDLLLADGVSLDASGMTGILADRNAGTSKSVTLSGYTLDGDALGNFVLSSSTTLGLANVDRAALTLTAVTDGRVYDGTTGSQGVVQVTGLVGDDQVTATQAFDSRNAGNRLLKVQNGYVVDDGNLGANYLVTLVDAAGVIDRRSTSTSVIANDKTYDGTRSATGSFAALTNLVDGDSVGATGTLTFADRNAGSSKIVSVTNAGLTGADAANYILESVADDTADIFKANLVLTAGADTKTYDGTTTSTGTVVASGLFSGDSVTATQSFDGRNAGVRALQVNAGWVVSDGNGGGNYNVTLGSATAGTITPKTITATATVNNKTYDGTTTATGTFANLNGVILGDFVTLDGTNGSLAFFDRNAGTGKAVVASGYVLQGTDAANYTLASIANGTADIYKASLVLNAVSADKEYDRTTSSNGDVQAVGLISGDTVIATQSYDGFNAGAHVLSVDGDYTVFDGNGGGNYTVTIGDTASGLITRKVLNAVATVNNKTYDGTTSATGSFSGLNGVISGDIVVLDDSEGVLSFLDRHAGNGKTVLVSNLGLGGADAANYQLSNIANGTANISRAELILTAVADSRTYDGTKNSSGQVQITGLFGSDSATAVQSFDSKNAGMRVLVPTAWLVDDGNNGNNYAVTLNNAVGEIFQRHLSGDLAGEVVKIYDGTTTATLQPVNLAGVIAGDDLTVSATSAEYDNRNAGAGKLVTVSGVILAGADASNYVLDRNYASGAIGMINARTVKITASGKGSKTYDGLTGLSTSQLGTITLSMADDDSLTRDLLALDGVTLDMSGVSGVLADRNAGSGKLVTLGGYGLINNGLGNYVLEQDGAIGIADVGRATLTLTAVADGKTYDGNDISSAAVLVGGLMTGDSINVEQAFDSKNAGARTVQVRGNYVIDDGNLGSNYIVSIGSAADGTIAQRVLTTTAHANDKVYDGGLLATGTFDPLSNLVFGDDVTISGATLSFSDRNVGQGKTVSVAGAGLAGNDAANYVLDAIADTTANITKAHLVLTASSDVKVYDGTSGSTGAVQVSGLAAGDQVSALQYFDSRNAGSRLLTVGNVSVQDGNGGGNYDVTLVNGTGTITQRFLSTVFTANDKSYDGTTTATGSFSAFSNLVSGDDVWIDLSNGSLSFADRNAGIDKTVSVNGVALGGQDAGNYLLNSVAAGSADITRAALTLSAVADTKTYDRTTSSSGLVQASGLVGGDGVTATQVFSDWNAGTHQLQVNGYTVHDGNGGNNYIVTLASPVSGIITPRALTVGALVNDKVYDGTTSATGSIGALGNVIAGDNVVASGGQFAFIDRNAGTGKLVLISGLTLAGADATNYVAAPFANGTASISKANLLLTARQDSKTYDGTIQSSGTVQVSGLKVGDALTASQAFDSVNAGGRRLQVTNWIVGDGNGGNNYVVTLADPVAGTITPRQITIRLLDASKIQGATDPVLSFVIEGQGLVSGDVMSGSASRAAGETIGRYAIGQGSLSAGSNYAVSVSPATFTILSNQSGGGTGGDNGGRGPITPPIVEQAHHHAHTGSQGTAPNNTIVATNPPSGANGFDAGIVFGPGGANNLPGRKPLSVQLNYGNGDGTADPTVDGTVQRPEDERGLQDLKCGIEGELLNCRPTVQGPNMPYWANRVVAPNLRFIQK